MGPAILLCPSSSSVQLWGQVNPLQKTRQKEGGISLLHTCLKCTANAHCPGDFKRRPPFFSHLASSSEACRRMSYPLTWRRVSAAASGGEVSVEEATIVSDEAPAEENEAKEASVATEEATPARTRKTQARRSFNRSNSNANKAAVVSPAELLPGAMFLGKVTSLQTFGAFVDLGAFTNGLVHISRLSKSYVKKVEDVVQVGQDVKVQILEVDLQGNRISLRLVEEDNEEASQEGATAEDQPSRAASQQRSRTPRRDSTKRQPSQRQQAATTTMKKGEIATGTVKNMIRSGVFITLPDGTDGYLPASEVVFKGPNTSMEANFQVGQELSVRVLRIDKGRVNLTMKREVDIEKLNEDLNEGVVGGATNPFELAFRRNELIASFLADRDKRKAEAEASKEARKEESDSLVKEVEDVAEVEKTDEEKVLNAVDIAKDEVDISEADASAEEVKAEAELEKPAVEEEEEKVADGVEARKEEALSPSEAVEEEKVPAAQKQPMLEEEEGKDVNGANAVSSEAVNSVEEVLGAAEVENPVESKKDEQVAGEDLAAKDEGVLSEAVNAVEEVNNAPELEKLAVKQEDEKVDGVEPLKAEAVSSEADRAVEEAKDAAEAEKANLEGKEEKGTEVDAAKGGAASSEAGAESVITVA